MEVQIQSNTLLNCKQAAEILGLSPMLFWLKRKKKHIVIPHFKLAGGKASRFKYDDVIALRESMKKGGSRWDDEHDNTMLDMSQTSHLLGISEGTLRSWKWHNRLPIQSKKINGKLRYKLSDIILYVENNKSMSDS